MMLIYWEERYVHTIKENSESLVVASRESGLEVNANKIQYMVMYRDQNAVRSDSIKFDNISSQRVEEIKKFGKNLK